MMPSALCYAAGYLTGLLAFLWMARRRGMATEGILLLVAVGLVGGLLCAGLTQRLVTGSAGKTVLGGIAGGYLSVMLAKRLLGIRRPTGDLFAVAICAGEAVGRWGCFFGGCCYGRPTHLPWAVWQHEAYRHPTQIYLSLASLAILLMLLTLECRPQLSGTSRGNSSVLWHPLHPLPENTIFYVQGALYCVARFCIEFWRDNGSINNLMAGPLSAAQWGCLAGSIFFVVRLIQTGRKYLLQTDVMYGI